LRELAEVVREGARAVVFGGFAGVVEVVVRGCGRRCVLVIVLVRGIAVGGVVGDAVFVQSEVEGDAHLFEHQRGAGGEAEERRCGCGAGVECGGAVHGGWACLRGGV
jgi:hypothetical protein